MAWMGKRNSSHEHDKEEKNMALSDKEFDTYRDRVFKFMWDEIAPLEDEIEKTHKLPLDHLWPRMAELGLFGLLIPPEYGGIGLSEVQFLEFEKEWSKIHGGLRVMLHVHNGGNDFVLYASDEMKEKYLRKLAKGESSCGFALTEPDGGTGLDIKCMAKKNGSNLILNGNKHLITNADFADVFGVITYIQDEKGQLDIKGLLVEKGTKGFTIGDMKPCMGCLGSYHGRLNFRDCVVPVGNLTQDAGIERALYGLNISRVRIAASALGTMERCLDVATEFAKKRVTFGKPIAQRQAIQRYLAEMAMDIYAVQLAVEDAGRKIDRGQNILQEANLCKMLAIEGGRRVTDNALLIMGGVGYTREYLVERLYRDLRLNWLEEGTPTIHYMVAAREVLNGNRTYKAFHKEEVESPLDRHNRLARSRGRRSKG